MNDVALLVDDISFAWGSNQVLKGASFAVRKGEVLCLMGANGCGKSTLLDCILGSNNPDEGVIELMGHDACELSVKDRAKLLSYVPQMHERSFPYSVEAMVLMGRTPYQEGFGSVDAQDRQIAWESMETCGIERLASRSFTSLSGGEAQMVLLARAMAQRSQIIVLDEPTAHLDFRNELLFLESVERLVLEHGVTIVMATHSPNQVFHLQAAGINVIAALMLDGRVNSLGSPDVVLTPQSLRSCFAVDAILADVALPSISERDELCSDDGVCREGSATIRQVIPLMTVDDRAD